MRNLRWGWMRLGGFLAELATFVVIMPLSLLDGEVSADYAAPPALFVATLALGSWVARQGAAASRATRCVRRLTSWPTHNMCDGLVVYASTQIHTGSKLWRT